MPELSVGYHATRQRITELVRGLDAVALRSPVPACPAWSVHDLVAHLSGAPGDLSVEELLRRWEASASATADLIDGGDALRFVDVVTHEHDLRAAVGRPGARGAPEVRACVPLLLDALASDIKAAGLRALVVDSGVVRWASHFSRPGCTLRLDPWQALRVLHSRRSGDEVRALAPSGNVEPYLEVLDARSPLPASSLHED